MAAAVVLLITASDRSNSEAEMEEICASAQQKPPSCPFVAGLRRHQRPRPGGHGREAPTP
jgi:hypothetical protein